MKSLKINRKYRATQVREKISSYTLCSSLFMKNKVMKTINITEVRSDWFIATMVMESGKIYQGIGSSKRSAIEELKKEFMK